MKIESLLLRAVV